MTLSIDFRLGSGIEEKVCWPFETVNGSDDIYWVGCEEFLAIGDALSEMNGVGDGERRAEERRCDAADGK